MRNMSSVDLKSAVDLINSSANNIEINIDFNSVTNAFRVLRNLCGTDLKYQNEVIRELNIVSSIKKIFFNILATESIQERIICLRIGLQFLGNLVVNNKHNQKQIWLTCEDLLVNCLKFKDAKVQNVCAMVLYNIFLGNPEFLNEIKHPFEDLYDLTLKENTSEFAVFTLEIFILKSNYLQKFYNELKPENRLIILEVIKNLIAEQNQVFQPDIIKFFSKEFTTKSDLILKTCANYIDSLDPVEVVKLLDLLIAFSSDDKQCYLRLIQNETSLLINCIELLKNIHFISKQSGNNFSMITKISEISKVENSTTIQEHPVFGFKCSLIRLIGNFCWKNTANQNQVRVLECIPILLDCCNIDARNPFIIQWCILAISNICEKNQENQQVIASLSKESKIDTARLQELGITLNTDEKNVLCIAPLK